MTAFRHPEGAPHGRTPRTSRHGVCSRPRVVSCVVEIRGAATDLLHPVVREGIATLRGALSVVGRSLPRQVEKELEGFPGRVR